MKDAERKQGRLYQEVQDGCLVLGYRRGAFVRKTCISADRQVEIDEKGWAFACTSSRTASGRSGSTCASGSARPCSRRARLASG